MSSAELEISRAKPSLGWLLQAFRQYSRARRVRLDGHLFDLCYDDPPSAPAGPLAALDTEARRCIAWLLEARDIADRREAARLYARWLQALGFARYRIIIPDMPSHNRELVSALRERLEMEHAVVEVPVDIPPESELSRRPPAAVRHLLDWAKTAKNTFHRVHVSADALPEALELVIAEDYGDVVLTDGVTELSPEQTRQLSDFASDAVAEPQVGPALDYLLRGGLVAKVLREARRLTAALSLDSAMAALGQLYPLD